MRTVAVFLLAVAAPALFAQPRSANPFGRILFPGGNPPAAGVQLPAGSRGSILFPGGGGAPYVNRGVVGGVWTTAPLNPPPPVHDHDRRPGAIAYPVAVPVYAGGYYNYDPPPAQIAYPTVLAPTYPQPQRAPEQPAPVVIINQYFRADEPPVTETVAQASAPAPASLQTATAAPVAPARPETIFMIAMKDHNVYTANAYWIEEGTLHFISTDGDERNVAMNDVDRDLSRRLNRDRNVAFGLPAN